MTRKKKIAIGPDDQVGDPFERRKIWPHAAPDTLGALPRERLLKMCPAIEGPVTVSFKHEDSISGMAVGPVVVTAKEPYEAWLKIHGVPHTNSRSGETRYLSPFGSTPEGRYQLGWVSRHVAGEIAAHYGVMLEEF